MAKRLAVPSKELALKIVGPTDSFLASRVQRITMNTDVPVTQVDEHGNKLHVGTVLDTPNITLTFSAFDVGVKIFSVLTGNDSTAYPSAGVDIGELGEMDAILFVKSATAPDVYVKMAHARRLQIRDFSFSYSVTGESTEDYTAIGSEKRWFKNDVLDEKFTTGTTSFTLSQTPVQLKNGNYALSVILDGEWLTEVDSGPATGEYSISGTTLTTFDSMTTQLIAVYQVAAGEDWTDVSDLESAAAVRGRDVKVVIGANDINRVQSVTINGNLNSQEVREMGSRVIIGYQSQVPTVEGTITVLDTDTELVDLFVNGSINSGDTEFQLAQGCTVSGVSLAIKIMDPCDVTAEGTVLKTIYIPSLLVTGDSFTSNVNENAQQTFNFQSYDAQCIIYSGAMP